MKKKSKTRDAGGEEQWRTILTSFRDTATRSNGFKVIRTRARPISARVVSMEDLLCLFTGQRRRGWGPQETTQKLGPYEFWVFYEIQMHEDFALMAGLWWDNLWSSGGSVRKSSLFEYPAEVKSTDWPCVLDVCNTVRSFTHESNTCVIRRWAFLILGFIDLLSWTPPPVTLLWPSLGGAQGLDTVPARWRSEKVSQGRSVSIHCNRFERTTNHVRQRPPWLCSCTIRAAQRIFGDFCIFRWPATSSENSTFQDFRSLKARIFRYMASNFF